MPRRGIAGIVALVALFAPASASADYVALGDSYAAGPLIPLQIQPFGCLKSNNNYAHIAQRTLAFAEFRDPTCSGAETEDMTQTQGVTPAPKVAAVFGGIHERSPQARAFVLTYAAIFPEEGSFGCWPQMPVAEGDIEYLRESRRS